MNIIATKPMLWLAGGLLISLAGNGAQYLIADSVASDHAAQLATIEKHQALAEAKASDQRVDALGDVATATAADEAALFARFEAATARIEGAATNYRTAKNAKPLSADCRADADRVRAINTARGHAG